MTRQVTVLAVTGYPSRVEWPVRAVRVGWCLSKPSLLLCSVLRLVLRRERLAFLRDALLIDLVDTDGSRTRDLLSANQVPYQLGYWPKV